MSTIKTLDLALIDLRAGLRFIHHQELQLVEALQAAVNNAFAERTLALEMALGTASERQEQSEKQGAGDEASAAPREPKLAAANG